MQEYIVYAIFIFVPIAVLMEYLLSREGLALKYRAIIVTASLAIIISFPFLMQYLGVFMALMVYLASIIALSSYFIRAIQSPAWYLRKGSSYADDEVYVSERLLNNTRVNTLGDIEDALWPQENSDNTPADKETESALSTESQPVASTTEGDINNIPEAEQVEQDKTDEFDGEISHNNEFDGQATDYLIAGADEIEESAKSVAAIEDEAEGRESSDALNTDDLSTEDELDQDEVIENENVATNEASYPDKEEDEVQLAEQTSRFEIITGLSQETAQSNEAEVEIMEDSSPGKAQENGLNELSDTNRLDLIIENSFALKQANRLLEAAQFFKEALEISKDEELNLLIILEIVELYKELGMYAQAEQVLFLSIGQAYTRTDIIDKIDRQLSYIRLLSLELDRLGLANTPISEVPRMVKMNVAEILEV